MGTAADGAAGTADGADGADGAGDSAEGNTSTGTARALGPADVSAATVFGSSAGREGRADTRAANNALLSDADGHTIAWFLRAAATSLYTHKSV